MEDIAVEENSIAGVHLSMYEGADLLRLLHSLQVSPHLLATSLMVHTSHQVGPHQQLRTSSGCIEITWCAPDMDRVYRMNYVWHRNIRSI